MKVQIEDSWAEFLSDEFNKTYFKELTRYIKERKASGAIIYPRGQDIFRAFNSCPLSQLKVVILGQDPYHGPGEAHGLCFSVPAGIRIPPSLRNIYKELETNLNVDRPKSGDLSSWAKQGVFMLNAILTVEHKSPASHKGKGWEQFTDNVIQRISSHLDHVVFILWGGFARSKKALIDGSKHLILEAPHPAAELYAGGKAGFFGSKPFSKANSYLIQHNKNAIDWLPSS